MTIDTTKPWVEAIVDTLLGTAINLPLNIILLWLAHKWSLSIVDTGVLLAIVFFIIAIIRKTIVRVYFKHKEDKYIHEV